MALIQVFPSGKSAEVSEGNVQVSSFPSASASNLGDIHQYTGETNINYTKGYFYECVYEDLAYKWKPVKTQESGSAEIETDPIDFNNF